MQHPRPSNADDVERLDGLHEPVGEEDVLDPHVIVHEHENVGVRCRSDGLVVDGRER